MSGQPEALKRLRGSLSQAAFGKRVGLDQKTISRLESGERELTLTEAIRLSQILGVSLTELNGDSPTGIDLTGDWFAAWQTMKDDVSRVDIHDLEVILDGSVLRFLGDRARPVEEGSYAWTGEMRMHDADVLLGWYRADDGAVRSKGVMYMTVHPHGTHMMGGWIGLSHQGPAVRGWAGIARDRELLERLMDDIGQQGRRDWITWPKTS